MIASEYNVVLVVLIQFFVSGPRKLVLGLLNRNPSENNRHSITSNPKIIVSYSVVYHTCLEGLKTIFSQLQPVLDSQRTGLLNHLAEVLESWVSFYFYLHLQEWKIKASTKYLLLFGRYKIKNLVFLYSISTEICFFLLVCMYVGITGVEATV